MYSLSPSQPSFGKSRSLGERCVTCQKTGARETNIGIKPTAHARKEQNKMSCGAVFSAVSSRVRRNFGEKFVSQGRLMFDILRRLQQL